MVIESLFFNISLTDFLFLSKSKEAVFINHFLIHVMVSTRPMGEWGCFKFFMSFFFVLLKLKMKGHSYIEYANN